MIELFIAYFLALPALNFEGIAIAILKNLTQVEPKNSINKLLVNF